MTGTYEGWPWARPGLGIYTKAFSQPLQGLEENRDCSLMRMHYGARRLLSKVFGPHDWTTGPQMLLPSPGEIPHWAQKKQW